MAESEFILVKAVEVSMSIEAAEKDVRTLGELPALPGHQQSVYKVTTTQPNHSALAP